MNLPKPTIHTAAEGGHVINPGDLVGLKPDLYAANHHAVDFLRGAVAGSLGEVTVVRAVSTFRIPARRQFALFVPAAETAPKRTVRQK